jgi:hypothetical protein
MKLQNHIFANVGQAIPRKGKWCIELQYYSLNTGADNIFLCCTFDYLLQTTCKLLWFVDILTNFKNLNMAVDEF